MEKCWQALSPSVAGSLKQEDFTVQVSLDKDLDSVSNITRAKKGWMHDSWLEHLPPKCETLSLNPTATEEKKNFNHT